MVVLGEELEDRTVFSVTPPLPETVTALLRDINTATNGSTPQQFTVVGSTLFFTATDGVNGEELWKSDGTNAGTTLVKDIRIGANGSFPTHLTNVNGVLFFQANNGVSGYELWKSDGTNAGTTLVKDINTIANDSFPDFLTNIGGVLFFRANEGVNGRELWKSDGTAAGTTLVKDIRTGPSDSGISALTNVNGTLFFAANDGVDNAELWMSNGTDAGTTLVKDIRAGASSSPTLLTNVNGVLYFRANDGVNGTELWTSNGTDAGTTILKDINTGGGSYPGSLTNVNGTLYFRANDGVNGYELWKSDGTAAGTTLVKDIRTGTSGSYPGSLTNVNGTLYFRANDGVNGYELWKSNGTDAGTILVKDMYPGAPSSHPGSLTNVSGVLFFTANDGVNGGELWTSNGTDAGTTLVNDINPGAFSSTPAFLTNVNGTLFFLANNGTTGTELWKSNGTDAGTTLVKDIRTGGGSNPINLTNVNGTLFFRAFDTNGYELWKSNGTDAGTTLVKDINPGPSGSTLRYLTNVNGVLYFTAATSVNGYELWKSDGTTAGTTLVNDINPGAFSSTPTFLTNVNGTLFFQANNGTTGTELWAITLTVENIDDGDADDTVTVGTVLTYTVDFSRGIDFATVGAGDFTNSGSAGITIGTISQVDADTITVEVTATSVGSLVLNVGPGITDPAGAEMIAAAVDADTITVVTPPGITVTPTAGLTTTEAGGTATFTIVLTSEPTADVTIPLSTSDNTEGTIDKTSVTFTAANWNVAQTVTITGVNDFLVDGGVAYAIVTAAATSADANYTNFVVDDVDVSNTDNDTAGITVTPTAGLTTTEAGGTATFTIVLTSEPTADVTIPLSTSDATEGTIDKTSVTFTAANWNVAQTVTITGVNDFLVDGSVAYTIVTAAATSTDANYTGFNASDVSVSNTDNDTAGITVTTTAGLTTTETGTTATFTIVLTSEPTADVTIPLSTSDNTEGTIDKTSVTFTAANWNVAQTVTITGVDDFLPDGDIAYAVVTGAATSLDANYNGLAASDVSVTNTGNGIIPSTPPAGGGTGDTTKPTVTISPPSASATGSGPITYTITYADANFNGSTLLASQVMLNRTGTAFGTVSVSPGSGATRTVTISNITGVGTLGISLVAGTASDRAGNLAPAAGPSVTFTVSPPASTLVVGASDGTVRIVNATTGVILSTLTPIAGYQGLIQVAYGDFNGDGVADLATAIAEAQSATSPLLSKAGKVFVYDGANLAKGELALLHTFTPFATTSGPGGTTGSYRNGLNIAVGDVNGDGKLDLVAGTRPGSAIAGQAESGRLVVVSAGTAPDGSADTILGSILTPFSAGYLKGVVVAVGDLDGVVNAAGHTQVEIAVTRGGPVAATNPNKSVKLKAYRFGDSGLTELALSGNVASPLAPFAGVGSGDNVITRDARIAFVDSDGDGKAELVVSALDPISNPASQQVRVAVFAVNTTGLATGIATGTGPNKSYAIGSGVVNHAIADVARSGGLHGLALVTESADSQIQFLNPLTGGVLPGGFRLTILTGGIALDGI